MSFETYDQIILWILIATAPAATLFPILFATTTPWHETLIGRALLVKSTAVFLLIDLSLLLRKVELSLETSMWLGLAIMTLICVGSNMQFLALVRSKIPAWRARWASRRA